MPALVEQDIRRLDVAMDETLRVRSVERVRHPREDRQRLLCLERLPRAEQCLQVAALDEAHRQKQPTVLLAGLVDREHVAVVERRRESRLAKEPLPEPGIL